MKLQELFLINVIPVFPHVSLSLCSAKKQPGDSGDSFRSFKTDVPETE